ncbi:MAG: hypothetical protein NUV75_02250 [Gallionella sp.]|nr:hypothetical protein [Gallionella sp.]
MTNHPNRKAFATIRNNDERITRRVHLYTRRVMIDGKAQYAIFTGSGEDCGPRYPTRDHAIEDAQHMWRGPWWDLQYA